MLFGLPRSNAVPESSQGLRPGTPLHVFKKARHLPQAKSQRPGTGGSPRVAGDASHARAVRARRDPNAPPPPPPPGALRGSLVLCGLAWLGAAVAEILLGTRILALVGLGLGGFALRWSFERPRHAGWWLFAASGVVALARVAWLLAGL
jgi:hypothetical protein